MLPLCHHAPFLIWPSPHRCQGRPRDCDGGSGSPWSDPAHPAHALLAVCQSRDIQEQTGSTLWLHSPDHIHHHCNVRFLNIYKKTLLLSTRKTPDLVICVIWSVCTVICLCCEYLFATCTVSEMCKLGWWFYAEGRFQHNQFEFVWKYNACKCQRTTPKRQCAITPIISYTVITMCLPTGCNAM